MNKKGLHQSIIVTQFCCRNYGTESKTIKQFRQFDALTKDNLKLRIIFLDLFCSSSIQNQHNQDFDWVILIDEDLPNTFFMKVQEIVKTRDRNFVIKKSTDLELDRLSWLKNIIRPDVEWLTTITHDDDDLLAPDYIDQVKILQKKHSDSDSNLMFKIFGTSHINQWDLKFSTCSPFGYISGWHRKPVFCSCGFGILSKYPEFDCSVVGLGHGLSHKYLETTKYGEIETVKLFWEKINECQYGTPKSSGDLNKEKFIQSIDTKWPTIMVNHSANMQWSRVLEKKPGTHKAQESFLMKYGLNLLKLSEHRKLFKPDLYKMFKYKRVVLKKELKRSIRVFRNWIPW